MIVVENVNVMNFKAAFRGMRNPLNSWSRSDSDFQEGHVSAIGQRDLDLLLRLCRSGSEHRKVLRQMMISFDLTAPLYFWKQFDTYKVGVTADSCSTMHTIARRDLTIDDFSVEGGTEKLYEFMDAIVRWININISIYKHTEDANLKKGAWNNIIKTLPESYNQKRTITMNYENALNMIGQRSNHKLAEWHDFTDFLRALPIMKDITEACFV